MQYNNFQHFVPHWRGQGLSPPNSKNEVHTAYAIFTFGKLGYRDQQSYKEFSRWMGALKPVTKCIQKAILWDPVGNMRTLPSIHSPGKPMKININNLLNKVRLAEKWGGTSAR